jgi:hypothetical protein
MPPIVNRFGFGGGIFIKGRFRLPTKGAIIGMELRRFKERQEQPRFGMLLILSASWILAAVTASGANVKLDAPSPVYVGQNFSVEVCVESVSDLYGAQFGLSFDPAVLRAESAGEGSFLEQGGANVFWNPPIIDNTVGTIRGAAIIRLTAANGVTGSGTIATVDFYAKMVGSSALTLSAVALSDPNANPISFSKQDGSVNIISSDPIPENDNVWSLLTAIIACSLGHRYRPRQTLGPIAAWRRSEEKRKVT